MNVHDAIVNRRSVKSYIPGTPIDDESLRALFTDVILTPSSFNIQHWNFVVIRDAQGKADLEAIAWGQKHVTQSSASILIVADPTRYLHAADDWARTQGVAPDRVERLRKVIPGFYDGQAQRARDEAHRSVGMAAMTLMLRAKEMGFDTCPMIGFDADAVAARFGIESPCFPAMLVVIGKRDEAKELWARPHRRGIAEVVRLESWAGDRL